MSGSSERALFVTHEGVRLSKDSLGNRVKHILGTSGIRPRHGCCHLFRHAMATQMLAGGADIRFIQEILCHSNLETQLYTKVTIEQLKQVHAATHPAPACRAAAQPSPRRMPKILRTALVELYRAGK